MAAGSALPPLVVLVDVELLLDTAMDASELGA